VRGVFRALFSQRSSRLAIAALGVIALSAILAPLIAPHDPLAQDVANRFAGRSREHWFGTDELGRDILSRVIFGARVSLSAGVGATILAAAVGIPAGLTAGYFSRWPEAFIMRGVDVLLSLPSIMLALVVLAVAGRGRMSAIVAVAMVNIPFFARIVRSQALTLREREFVLATKLAGASHSYVMWRTILPNSLQPLTVQIVVTATLAILLEAELSFLGLGQPPPAPSWGDMLRQGKSYFHLAPSYAMLPGLALTVTILCLDAVGRALGGRGRLTAEVTR
jgi:peptide/nickel transport system permease protein